MEAEVSFCVAMVITICDCIHVARQLLVSIRHLLSIKRNTKRRKGAEPLKMGVSVRVPQKVLTWPLLYSLLTLCCIHY